MLAVAPRHLLPVDVEPTRRRLNPTTLGLGLTFVSTVTFAWIGVLTQLGYEGGASVGTMLAGRFFVAAVILWPLALLTRSRRPDRRQVARALVLGLGYAAHAWLFSESLARLDAGLVDLLLFTYPALVTLGAIALGRDRWCGRRTVALVTAAGGAALVLVGGLGVIDPKGAALALGAAVAYASYILSSAGELKRTDPLTLAALVTTSAAVALTIVAAVRNDLSFDIATSGLASIVGVGLVTVIGMSTFIVGIGLLGPARASIVSAVQPAFTAVVGLAVFGDRMGPSQLVGGAMVIASVVILEAGRRPVATHPGRSGVAHRLTHELPTAGTLTIRATAVAA
jgi:drug/metabolite transporter (DMT)-like permease